MTLKVRINSRMRVFLFAFIYFIVLSGYVVYLMMRTLASAEPEALIWYLKSYSLDQLLFIVMIKIDNNPMAMLFLAIVIFSVLLFGFLTELGVSFLERYYFQVS